MFVRKLSVDALVDNGDGFEAYDSQFDGAMRVVYNVFGVFNDESALKAIDALTDDAYDSLRATQLRCGVYEVVCCSF